MNIKLHPVPNRSQNNFACDIGRRKINRIEVVLFLIIYSGHGTPPPTQQHNRYPTELIELSIGISLEFLVTLI